jgi:hypothetical protein
MRLLFAISIASFCATLWVALSFTRRVKLHRSLRRRPAPRRRRWQTQEFFEAGEFRTPRLLTLKQHLDHTVAQAGTRNRRRLALRDRPVLDRPYASTNLVDLSSPPTFPAPYRVPVTSFPASSAQARTGTSLLLPPAHPAGHRQNVISISNAAPTPPHQRKAPQPTRPQDWHSSMRRVDLSRFGKNTGALGDLSDPYTSFSRSAATQGPMLKRP